MTSTVALAARRLETKLLRRLGSVHSLYWLAEDARASRGPVAAALARLAAAGCVVQLNHVDAGSPLSAWVRADVLARLSAASRAA